MVEAQRSPSCLAFFMRHSIRADKFTNKIFGHTKIEKKFDPPITEDGKILATETGLLI